MLHKTKDKYKFIVDIIWLRDPFPILFSNFSCYLWRVLDHYLTPFSKFEYNFTHESWFLVLFPDLISFNQMPSNFLIDFDKYSIVIFKSLFEAPIIDTEIGDNNSPYFTLPKLLFISFSLSFYYFISMHDVQLWMLNVFNSKMFHLLLWILLSW